MQIYQSQSTKEEVALEAAAAVEEEVEEVEEVEVAEAVEAAAVVGKAAQEGRQLVEQGVAGLEGDQPVAGPWEKFHSMAFWSCS